MQHLGLLPSNPRGEIHSLLGLAAMRTKGIAYFVSLIVIRAVASGIPNVSFNNASALLPLNRAPLHTEGRYIVDNMGKRVKWACAAWYGLESKTFAAGGLEAQPLEAIVHRIRELGFNCVRLPYSIEAQVVDPVVEKKFLLANPQFHGQRWHHIFDATVQALTSAGLMVIIDQHVSKAGWCCFAAQAEGLWYQAGYPEELWIESLANMTRRYQTNAMVVGIELRNELHDYGSVWLTWGSGDIHTDWFGAATRAAKRIQEINTDILIVVEALCFGMELRGLKNQHMQLQVPQRVVYAVHNYREFNPWAIFDEFIAPWSVVCIVCVVLLLLLAFSSARLVVSWRSAGRPRPAKIIVNLILASWASCAMLFFLLVGCLIIKTACIFCTIWVTHDLIPIVVGLALVSLVPISVASVSYFQLTRERRLAEDLGSWQQLDTNGNGSQSNGNRVGVQDAKSERRWIHMFAGHALATFFVILFLILGVLGNSYWLQKWFYDRSWGFAISGEHEFTAPVWMGEIAAVESSSWWLNTIRYLFEHDVDFAYWAINGMKWSEGNINQLTGVFTFLPEPKWDDEPYGLLKEDYSIIRAQWRLSALQQLMPAQK